MPKMKYYNGSAWVALDAQNGDTVDGLHFRINASKLQYSTDGTIWVDAGTNTSDATGLASDVLAGKTVYVNGIKITGTMVNRTGDVLATAVTSNGIGEVILTPPVGFYNGTTRTYIGDPDFVSSNIRAGVNIFGVVGATAVMNTAGVNATAGALLSGYNACVQGAVVNGTIPIRTNTDTGGTYPTAVGQSFYDGMAYLMPPAGYFDGGTWVKQSVPNLLASNLRAGTVIGSITGTMQPALYASGTVLSSSSGGTENFTRADGTLVAKYSVTVSGLTFKPKIIIVVFRPGGSYFTDWFTVYTEFNQITTQPESKINMIGNVYNLVSPAYVTSTGFKFPAGWHATTFDWFAFG